MRSTREFGRGLFAALVLVALAASPARAIVVVYDLRLDWSDVNNPNNVWAYLKGATPLSHFTPLPQAQLSPAVANGYWGDSSANFNSAIMKTTANGASTGFFSNNDFLAGDVLLRTTDPSTGGPMVVTWTAPSAGTFTYSGDIWYAGAVLGPGSNDFVLQLNNGPNMESGTAGLGQDQTNPVTMVNGLTPTSVSPGDVLALTLTPSPGPFSGSLAGVGLVVDFVPAPEPSTITLAAVAALGLAAVQWPRKRKASNR